MASSPDIQELREAIRELRSDLHQIREKITTDVNSAFGISRDLHQQQALMVARLEVRIEAVENQAAQVLRILQGNGVRTGVVARMDLLEQAVHIVEESNKIQDDTLQTLQARTPSCVVNAEKIKSATEKAETLEQKADKLEKAVDSLKTKEAQLRGGWIALGVSVGVCSGIIALAIQLWKLFYS